TRDLLRVPGGIGRHVRGRIAALTIGDAAVMAAKVAHLRLPTAVVASIFMHENDRRPRADRLDIKLHAVRCGNLRHCGVFKCDSSGATSVAQQRKASGAAWRPQWRALRAISAPAPFPPPLTP